MRGNLRHNKHYNQQETFDKLYAQSNGEKIFNNLMEVISSEENIKLAYRNIKRTEGNMTAGVDKLMIKDIENTPMEKFIEIVRKKMSLCKSKAVKQVESPKPNEKIRPLGITVAIAYKLDLPAQFKLKSRIPYFGCVLTGILLSRGSNYFFDLITKISEI